MVRAWWCLALVPSLALAGEPAPHAFMEMDVAPKTVYVGQQAMVTVRLYGTEGLLTSALSDPACDGAILRHLGEGMSLRVSRRGVSYDVFERRYALFPLRAGSLSVRAPTFKGAYSLKPGPAMPFGGRLPTGGLREVTMSAQPRELQVTPAPRVAGRWLPAEGVELVETLDPPVGPYPAGKVIRRRVVWVVRGQLHTSLTAPDVSYPAGMQVLSDAPETATEMDNAGAVARWIGRWALIPEQEGEIVLPEVGVAWWDTVADRERRAVIPSRSIQVAKAPARVSDEPSESESSVSPVTPWVLGGAALMGWLGVVILLLRQRLRARIAPAELRTGARSSGEGNRELKQALREGHAAAVRTALIVWARARFGDRRIIGLQDIAAAAHSDPLRRELLALDRSMYGVGGSWSPVMLAQAVGGSVAADRNATTPSALKPLYEGEQEAISVRSRAFPLWTGALVAVGAIILAITFARSPSRPLDDDAYRALVAGQEGTVVEFLSAFERIQDDLAPQRVPDQQHALSERFGTSLTALREALDRVTPPAGREAFHDAWHGAISNLESAHRDFTGAGARDFVGAFFRSRRAFVDAVFQLYRVQDDAPVVRTYFSHSAAVSTSSTQGSGVVHEPANDQHGGFSLYVPETYDEKRAWPLIVALHGSHGSGRGALATWLRPAISKGWIVLAPKSLEASWGIEDPDHDVRSIAAALAQVTDRYRVDPKRLFITGLSDGGTFSYVLGTRCPRSFSGIVPIAAVLPPHLDISAANRLPVLIVHGSEDWVFPEQSAREAHEALTSAGLSDVTLVSVPGWGHGLNYGVNEKYVLPWLDARSSAARLAPLTSCE